jgi:uncharacterized protein (TIGR00106 family)
LNLIEVILAQGSRFGRPAGFCFLAPVLGPRALADLPLLELHMAHPSFSLSRRFRLPLFALALLACGAAGAQASSPPAPQPTPSRHMIAEIQVVPRPIGTAEDRYKHVDAALAIIQASGLRYEVHALGTVIEGPPEQIWPLLQAVHQATLEAGAERTLSVIKISSGAAAGGPRVEDLVRKFRK